MYSEIIKKYLEETTDIVKEIYVKVADHFQGRHYDMHHEFANNTPAHAKAASLNNTLESMIGNNKSLKKVSNKLYESMTAMYSSIPDFFYFCGLKDSANIKNDT